MPLITRNNVVILLLFSIYFCMVVFCFPILRKYNRALTKKIKNHKSKPSFSPREIQDSLFYRHYFIPLFLWSLVICPALLSVLTYFFITPGLQTLLFGEKASIFIGLNFEPFIVFSFTMFMLWIAFVFGLVPYLVSLISPISGAILAKSLVPGRNHPLVAVRKNDLFKRLIKLDVQKEKLENFRRVIHFVYYYCVVTVPLLILAISSYISFTPTDLKINRFADLFETQISYSDIDSVSLFQEIRRTRRNPYSPTGFFLYSATSLNLKNDQKVVIDEIVDEEIQIGWLFVQSEPNENLLDVLDLLHSKHVPFIFVRTPILTEPENQLNNDFEKEYLLKFYQYSLSDQ